MGADERLATRLGGANGLPAVGIEHVGSTAVLGLVAGPILDAAVGLAASAHPPTWLDPRAAG